MLKYENVTFLKEPVKGLSKEDFIARNVAVFWQNREEATRRKMLGQVYDLINKPARKVKNN